MKKAFFYSLLLLVNTTYAQIDLKKGLTLHYTFDNEIKDLSKNNIQASYFNTGYTGGPVGGLQKAASFNGKNQYIRIKNNQLLNFNSAFSISVWVKVNGFYSGECHGNRIIMKGDQDYDNGNYFLTFDDHHYTNGNNCNTEMPDINHQQFYGPGTNIHQKKYISANQWYRLSYIFDGKSAYLYVNCELYASGRLTNTSFSNDADLFIGRLNNSKFPYWFNGAISDFRIYNRALTKGEINELCKKNYTVGLETENPCLNSKNFIKEIKPEITNCNTSIFKPLINSNQKTQIRAWHWRLGDGSESLKAMPSHTYKKYGSYLVKLIATSSQNCKDTITKLIRIKPIKADFSHHQIYPGKLVFESKNDHVLYNWNFGDSTAISRERKILHTYSKSGTFITTLFVKNNRGCIDSASKTISVSFPPSLIKSNDSTETVDSEITKYKQNNSLEERSHTLIKEIITENDSVLVSIYDTGAIDGDSITLLFNGKIITEHKLLTAKSEAFILHFDKKKNKNELVMYAENLGSIPPNTALVVIHDSNKTYEINISSSYTSNGMISFVLKR